MNFQTIWIPKRFWQNFCQKKAGPGKHSYLKYALIKAIMYFLTLILNFKYCHQFTLRVTNMHFQNKHNIQREKKPLLRILFNKLSIFDKQII